MTGLVFVGAGGFGLEMAGYVRDCVAAGRSDFTPQGFLDDTKPRGALHAGLPILGPIAQTLDPSALYLICMGELPGRRKLAETITAGGGKFATLVHPLAYVVEDVVIGAGTIIAPFAFIGAKGHVGSQSLINVHASIGHEARLGDYSILAPYASIQGRATVESNAMIGAYACVTSKLTVGSNVRIAAGSVVYNDVPPDSWVLGNPARFKKAEG